MDTDFLRWVVEVMRCRPCAPNSYLNSPRGIQIARLCIDFERQNYSWRRADADTFWIDVQLFTKYKLSDDEVLFFMKTQPGVDNYRKYSAYRKAYAEMMRGLRRLRALEIEKRESEQDTHKQ